MPESSSYLPVPVKTAWHVADAFRKDIVVILAWDHAHNLIHTTTYGKSAEDKIKAAELGPFLNHLAGGFTPAAHPFEDFRDAALAAESHDRELSKLQAEIAELRTELGFYLNPGYTHEGDCVFEEDDEGDCTRCTETALKHYAAATRLLGLSIPQGVSEHPAPAPHRKASDLSSEVTPEPPEPLP